MMQRGYAYAVWAHEQERAGISELKFEITAELHDALVDPRTLDGLNAMAPNAMLGEYEEGTLSADQLPAAAEHLRDISRLWQPRVRSEMLQLSDFMGRCHRQGAAVMVWL